ncbi:hypothetical protein [Rubrimonas cliftonensis]|uniref:Uncharacterized protein n=1 Tax=Rubrimonas cliftonensis TaxID=89524 RepID=A0A1H4CY86_9RHOB|nr:hypothetical protein [Rubrimonas cliftonensis]SEA65290.1 hypothetical protein SAMN05444370_108105 [Rubrimonas cliftonensis]
MGGLKWFGAAAARRAETLAARVEALEDALREERGRREHLEARLEALAALYERRVDLIYARLLEVLPELAAAGRLGFLEPPGRESSDGRAPLAPGAMTAPLTMHGFRLTLGGAVEREDAVEILGARRGIALFGPYRRLPAGRWRVTWRFRAPEAGAEAGGAEAPAVGLEAVDAATGATLASGRLGPLGAGAWGAALVVDAGDALSNPLELRARQLGEAPAFLTAVELEPLGAAASAAAAPPADREG